MTARIVFKIVDEASWRAAEAVGRFDGSPVDHRDGFIHLSTAEQVAETASRHFAGRSGLLLVAIATRALGDALRWEPSRGGALFPHFYGALSPDDAIAVVPLELDESGRHVLPMLDAPPYTL
ncbi:MAG: DUF952 domain-containing protein [Vicinamibacterales bacterium]